MHETTSRATMNAWANAMLGTGQSRQGGGPRTPLYSQRAMEDADDAEAPANVVPPAPPRRCRRTRPVTFICVQTPGLALGLASGGLHMFEDGRLTLDRPEDIAAMRKHAWYGGRILEDRPTMREEIAAQQLLYGRQKLRQRELAGDAQTYSREMGGRGPFGPDPDTGLGRFPVRRR